MSTGHGPGPVVRALHRHVPDVEESGEIRAGFLSPDTFRPYPPGAMVVLDAGEGWWAHAHTCAVIAGALAHTGHIAITGTGPDRTRGADERHGALYGLDAIADAITRAHALYGHVRALPP
ncbi:hypothetical protein ACFYT4_05000 [Streptomyces sp. NPDC004609]|uniref:hypothetical protein n=1 Tax=Streptomyces sp. NPDC004609 TaxID=3364704 RepID=UPI003687024F